MWWHRAKQTWQKWNIIFISMFLLVHNHHHQELLCFQYLYVYVGSGSTSTHTEVTMLSHYSPFHTETHSIMSAVEVRQFSTIVCSLRTQQLQHEATLVCNLHSKPVLRIQMRRDGSHHDVPVSSCSSNMYPLTVYNHMDAVIWCCDWNPDPPCTLESCVFPL